MGILGPSPGVRRFWSKSPHSWLAAILIFCPCSPSLNLIFRFFHILRGASGMKNKNPCPGAVDHFSSKRPQFWTLSMDTNWLDMLSGMVIFLFFGPPAKSLLIRLTITTDKLDSTRQYKVIVQDTRGI